LLPNICPYVGLELNNKSYFRSLHIPRHASP
jgi:hypothetical protein